VLTVDTDALCAAIKDIFQDTRSLVEPAGALAVAGLKQYAATAAARAGAGRDHIGRQHEFDRLRIVAERAEVVAAARLRRRLVEGRQDWKSSASTS
jgi:threonine dehydratase